MSVLHDAGVDWVYHYTPLHYLPFIARTRQLLSKSALERTGFKPTHFRSKSKSQDINRGFGQYLFLTLEQLPKLARAKLDAGFPHIAIAVPVNAVEQTGYSLCRFNTAMTRTLRRDGKPGYVASCTNGRYYGKQQIPVARKLCDKHALLKKYWGKSSIEVLINGRLNLPKEATVHCYSESDRILAAHILGDLDCHWRLIHDNALGDYERSVDYVCSVEEFVRLALADAEWRGNELEFDRV